MVGPEPLQRETSSHSWSSSWWWVVPASVRDASRVAGRGSVAGARALAPAPATSRGGGADIVGNGRFCGSATPVRASTRVAIGFAASAWLTVVLGRGRDFMTPRIRRSSVEATQSSRSSPKDGWPIFDPQTSTSLPAWELDPGMLQVKDVPMPLLINTIGDRSRSEADSSIALTSEGYSVPIGARERVSMSSPRLLSRNSRRNHRADPIAPPRAMSRSMKPMHSKLTTGTLALAFPLNQWDNRYDFRARPGAVTGTIDLDSAASSRSSAELSVFPPSPNQSLSLDRSGDDP